MVTEFTDNPRSEDVSRPERGNSPAEDNVSAARSALVKNWLDTVKDDIAFFDGAFKQMEKNQQLATEGADEDWVRSGKYVAPISVRLINQSVSQLYARNPKMIASRRKKLQYVHWDGQPESIKNAIAKMQPPQSVVPSPIPGVGAIDTVTGAAWRPDPMAVAVLQEVAQAQIERQRMDNLGRTLVYLWDYFTGELVSGFKTQMKAAVRRTKVCGVSYVKLLFQRDVGTPPDVIARLDDARERLRRLEVLYDDLDEGELDENSAEMEELRLLINTLQSEPEITLREGPVFEFPEADAIVPDRNGRHLKTFLGCGHVTHRFMMTPERIEEVYGVDVCGKFTAYDAPDASGAVKARKAKTHAWVYEVHDKKNGQVFTLCDGYPDFVVEPREPDVRVEGFWTIFPLVFNEVDNKKKMIPPADVYLARHPAAEYNRAREGLREHRLANRPKYATPKGALEKTDKDRLKASEAHSVIEFKSLKPGADIKSLVQRLEMIGIDPNMYEVNQLFQDIQRAVGMQEASLGGLSGASATETSIAQSSLGSSIEDNVDDLDEMLGRVAHAFAQLCLLELSKDTVIEIVGPGAVWPDIAESREEIARDFMLDVKGGSSGRPNAAAEIAKIERVLPHTLTIPGAANKAMALLDRALKLLDIDPDQLNEESLPPLDMSIVARNALDGRGGPPTAHAGNPARDPNAQGGEGATNAPNAQRDEPGPQPAMPAPGVVDGAPMKQA